MTAAELAAALQALPVEQQRVSLLYGYGYLLPYQITHLRTVAQTPGGTAGVVLYGDVNYYAFMEKGLTVSGLAQKLQALPPDQVALPVYVEGYWGLYAVTGLRPITQDWTGQVVYVGLVTGGAPPGSGGPASGVQPAAPRGSLKTKFDDP